MGSGLNGTYLSRNLGHCGPEGLNTQRARERSEAIFCLKIQHLEIAASLALLYALGYRNDVGLELK